MYDSIGCRKCHGDQGRAMALGADPEGRRRLPDFRRRSAPNWRFRGGGSVRISTGGCARGWTHADAVVRRPDRSKVPHRRGAVAPGAVRTLALAGGPAEVRDVVHAPQITGTVPVSPDDSAWARVARYWFPLVGQVIHKARWFAPAVSGVWVQALHDGKTLALRVSWDDRTESPDTAWLKFEQRILEPSPATTPQAPPKRSLARPAGGAVPRHLPQGMERPYFLMGPRPTPSISGAGPAGRAARSPVWAAASSDSTPPRRAGRGGGLRAWRVAPGADARPCDVRYRQRSSA